METQPVLISQCMPFKVPAIKFFYFIIIQKETNISKQNTIGITNKKYLVVCG